MQEDPIRKFSLAKIDVNCLHNIVTHSTVRFVNLLKERDDAVRKSKIISPTWRSATVGKILTPDPVAPPVHPPMEREKDDSFQPLPSSPSGNSRVTVNGVQDNGLASDFGWGSEEEGREDVSDGLTRGTDARPRPRRLSLEGETSPLTEAKEFTFMKLDSVTGPTEGLENEDSVKCDFLFTRPRSQEKAPDDQLDPNIPEEMLSEWPPYEPPLDVGAKTVRCYPKRPPKSIQSQIVQPDEWESPFCIISEVVGNAKEAFPEEADDQTGKAKGEPVVITPQKTTDITKIKGWRRKQFLVEKLTTVEFYRYEEGPNRKKIRLVDFEEEPGRNEDPGNVENAFVCDSLDDFLNNDAELKINYEIPHLYAEVGIKLTSEDLVSKPNLTEEDYKEVGSRYCVQLPPLDDDLLPDQLPEPAFNEKTDSPSSPYKILKIDNNRRRFIDVEPKTDTYRPKGIPKSVSILKSTQPKPYVNRVSEDTKWKKSSDVSFMSKLFGLAVYPSWFRPLHPIVQKHLHKLRSYRTRIDRNWANFAVCAVRAKWQNRFLGRRILPVYCAGKVVGKHPNSSLIEQEVKDVVNFLVDSVSKNPPKDPQQKTTPIENTLGSSMQQPEPEGKARNRTSLPQECRVILNKLVAPPHLKIWCMEHECYDCNSCRFNDLRNPTQGEKKQNVDLDPTDLCVVEIGSETEEPDPLHSRSSLSDVTTHTLPNLFDQRLTNLLKQKLRDVAFSDDILINVDKLRTTVPDGLELIKLNFIKQSFLMGTLYLWYLKPTSDSYRTRAFLTFSRTSPETEAVNIDRNQVDMDGLPKVITEIVSSEKVFDHDEYGILHCNGITWEIHGSLKIGGNKNLDYQPNDNDMEVEQVVIPVPIPEMKEIRKIAMQILRVKASKWWVLDLSQHFSELVFHVSGQRVATKRSNILSVIESKYLGFLLIKKRKGRCYGLFILENTFPFVLVGPYYTFEKSTVSLREDSKKISFAYTALENVTKDDSIKFYINSVISVVGEHKRLNGLWLYDKKTLDNACYLETLTTDVNDTYSSTDYSIQTEHDYALNTLTTSPPAEKPNEEPIYSSSDAPAASEVAVYLYFDVFELGYVSGILHPDNSILISHPLSRTTRIKSHHVGKIFINLLKRRILFIPKTLKVKWFITQLKEDLQGREPFNRFILGGIHVLCEKGLFSMAKLTDEKIRELGLQKKEVLKHISRSEVLHEVAALKHLRSLVTEDAEEHLSMDQVLQLGIEIIKDLKLTEKRLAQAKDSESSRKVELWRRYAILVNEQRGGVEDKVRYLFNVVRRKHKQREVDEGVQRVLEEFEFGKRFVEDVKSSCTEAGSKSLSPSGENAKEKPKTGPSTCKKTDKRFRQKVKRKAGASEEDLVKTLEAKVFDVCKSLDKKENSLNVPEYKELIKKLDAISSQINSIKNKFKESSKKGLQTAERTPKALINGKKRGEKEKENGTNNFNPKANRAFIKLDPSIFSDDERGNLRNAIAKARQRIKQKHVNKTFALVKPSNKQQDQANGTVCSSPSENNFTLIRQEKSNAWAFEKLKPIHPSNLLENSPA